MNFKEAYLMMMEGKKIKRPCFKGYWYFNGKTGKIVIHLENGTEITEGDFTLTLQNSLAEDWEIYYDNYFAYNSMTSDGRGWLSFESCNSSYSEDSSNLNNETDCCDDKENVTTDLNQTPEKPDIKSKKAILG